MSTIRKIDKSGYFLFGKARRALLSLLYGHAGEEFYLRQIERMTGIGIGQVQRELKMMTEAGTVIREQKGNQVYYHANEKCPIFNELKSIVIKILDVAEAIPYSLDVVAQRFRVPEDILAEYCRKHHITRLALFGSVLREDFRPDSDIDVLVEFEPGHVPGFGIIDMENELSQMVGRKVDLRTPRDLSRYFRDRVVKESRVEYAKAR